jgi:hypothetical protein
MRNLSRRWCIPGFVLAASMLCSTPALAADPVSSAEAASPPSRLLLVSSTTQAAPQQSGRYSLRARFAPAESAGELREGGDFTLIGRFAKGAVICSSTDAIFRNGFESP